MKEGLKSVATIPVKQEEKVIANIVLASHKFETIPQDTKENIEYIVNHIGITIIKTRLTKLIKESEEKYRELVDGIGEGFFAINKDGIFTFANRSLAKILGLNDEKELLGRNFIDFIKDSKKEKYFSKFLESVSTGDLAFNFEMSAIRVSDSSELFLEVRCLPIIQDGRLTGVRGLVSDKSEKIIAQKEKELLNKELISKNKELEQIIYIASHDLRSPLVNVIGFSNELGHAVDKIKSYLNEIGLNDQMKEKLNTLLSNDINESLYFIKNSINKMESLLKGMLKVSRLTKSKMELREIKMNQMIAEILNNFDYSLKTKKH